MDEVELAEAAIFSLKQAAQRLRTLAEQTQSADLRDRLRALADSIDEQTRHLLAQRRASA
ncbi:hypothetical protein KF840_03610 [bacterium]|nr:hypothetical protein [bacterium]